MDWVSKHPKHFVCFVGLSTLRQYIQSFGVSVSDGQVKTLYRLPRQAEIEIYQDYFKQRLSRLPDMDLLTLFSKYFQRFPYFITLLISTFDQYYIECR